MVEQHGAGVIKGDLAKEAGGSRLAADASVHAAGEVEDRVVA
jgi:hypothetical protein